MRHTGFRKKNSSFKVIGVTDAVVHVWTFTLNDGLTAQDDITPEAIGDYYSAKIDTPDSDCFMFVVQDGTCGITRIGDPEVLVISYSGIAGETYSYKQLGMDGGELDSGDMTEISDGFYYIEPASLDESFFDIDGELKTLVVPYNVVVCTDGGVVANGIFNNTGFNMFGFLGERHSYFDLDNGKWVKDDDVEAKASDLAKAVCSKYDLVWDDENDDKWIGNYIKYLLSYEENSGRMRYYKPYKTPDGNAANFSLMQKDEADNLVVKGVSMYLLQTLETVNGTDGATITFREDG